MGWFGGDSNSSDGGNSGRDKSFSTGEDFSGGGGANMMSSSSGGGGGGGGAAGGGGQGAAELQQMSMMLQQQMLIQQVINDLSDKSYEKCITSRPNDTLNGTQVACISSTVNKWLDTNEFINGRLGKKAQQQQQQQAGGGGGQQF
jgi:hypothetical protein